MSKKSKKRGNKEVVVLTVRVKQKHLHHFETFIPGAPAGDIAQRAFELGLEILAHGRRAAKEAN